MSMIYFVCPKCNATTWSIHNLREKCKYCEIEMIETKYKTPEPYNKEVANKIEQIIFEEYVKDNPLYDPQEEKATQEKDKQIVEEFHREQAIKQSQPKPNVPKCPTCNSTNVEKIGTLERGISVTAWGLFSSKLGKTMKCKNCGYKW